MTFGKANPRSADADFARSCGAGCVWKAAAPQRLHRTLPDHLQVFSQLGTAKPDLLFRCAGRPALYVEAKLGCQTEPLQLTRARSWMRATGAKDDQVLLISHFKDELPDEVGWTNATVPIRSMSWHELEQRLQTECDSAVFASKLFQNSREAKCKKKRGLLFKTRHPYGTVMQKLIATWGGAEPEFSVWSADRSAPLPRPRVMARSVRNSRR